MTRRAAVILLLILAAAVAALLLWTRAAPTSVLRRKPRVFLRVTAALPPPVSPGAATPTPAEMVRLTLFFPGKDDGRLRPEERDIAKPVGVGASLRAIFAELAKGPTNTELVTAIPSRIQLRNAFLLPEGEVILDLAVDSGLSFGSDEELTIVASIVDTVLQNVADSKSVRILVNGEPAESLGGHVDLTRPLLYLREELAS